MHKNELLTFIAKAHRSTYAAPKDISKRHRLEIPFIPGHKCYYFKDGEWEYYDGYAGSEWAPGREVVLLRGKPVWAMSYQGRHNEKFPAIFFQDEVFPFLKKALMSMDKAMPFRGPKEFVMEDFKYVFELKGRYQYFTGRETIFHKGIEVFSQDVMGELIK
ncbi:hypothetical protein J4464_02240 [Candidatus Woesearchaeota archaeon]|nr:hypothetical protein [Candidatus Woesearchaeota archaeon]